MGGFREGAPFDDNKTGTDAILYRHITINNYRCQINILRPNHSSFLLVRLGKNQFVIINSTAYSVLLTAFKRSMLL